MTTRERPILFNGAMVRAILDGWKTQTRRAVKGMPLDWLEPDKFTPEYVADPGNAMCPFGQPGDRLWVRETWYCDDYRVQRGPFLKPDDLDVVAERETGGLVYAADGLRPYESEQPVWRPSIHMPRWACRLVLEITDVRVERLQAISEADAEAEGADPITAKVPTHRDAFRYVWEDTGGDWAANPWVWVIAFKSVEAGHG